MQSELIDGDLANEDDMEEYINISIKPTDVSETDRGERPLATPSTPPSSASFKDKSGSNISKEERIPTGSPPKKGFSFLSSGQGIFHRRKNKSSNENKVTSRGSPEMKRKFDNVGVVHYDKKDTTVKLSPPFVRKEIPKVQQLPKNDSGTSLSKLEIKDSVRTDSNASKIAADLKKVL